MRTGRDRAGTGERGGCRPSPRAARQRTLPAVNARPRPGRSRRAWRRPRAPGVEGDQPEMSPRVDAAEVDGQQAFEQADRLPVVARPVQFGCLDDRVGVPFVGLDAGDHLFHLEAGPHPGGNDLLAQWVQRWPASPQYSSVGSQSPIGCNANTGATSAGTGANRGYTHGIA